MTLLIGRRARRSHTGRILVDVKAGPTQIVISGSSGDYGKKGWKLTEGDDLEIAVWNPQNGVGPARYRLHVVSPRVGR